MFGKSLRCLLTSGLCFSGSSKVTSDQFVFEEEGSPVLRRFNVTSSSQLDNALSKALVGTPSVTGFGRTQDNSTLELWSRYLASYPGPHRCLLSLQRHPIAYQVTVRGLPGARL